MKNENNEKINNLNKEIYGLKIEKQQLKSTITEQKKANQVNEERLMKNNKDLQTEISKIQNEKDDLNKELQKLQKDFKDFKEMGNRSNAMLKSEVLKGKQINKKIIKQSSTIQQTLRRTQKNILSIKQIIKQITPGNDNDNYKQFETVTQFLDIEEGNIESVINRNCEIIGLINGNIIHFESNSESTEEQITLNVTNIITEGIELQHTIEKSEVSDKSIAIYEINTMRNQLKSTKPENQSKTWFHMERWTEILGERCPLVTGNIGLYNTLILFSRSFVDFNECSELDRITRILILFFVIFWITLTGYKQRPLKGNNDTIFNFFIGFYLNYIVLLLFVALSSLLPYSCWLNEEYLNYIVICLIIITGLSVFISDWMNKPAKRCSDYVGCIELKENIRIVKYPIIQSKKQSTHIKTINFVNSKQLHIKKVEIEEINNVNELYGTKAMKQFGKAFVKDFGKEIVNDAIDTFGDDVKQQFDDKIQIDDDVKDKIQGVYEIVTNMEETKDVMEYGSKQFKGILEMVTTDKTLNDDDGKLDPIIVSKTNKFEELKYNTSVDGDKLDEYNYKSWSAKNVSKWIISLDYDKYNKYEKQLTQSLIEQDVTGDVMDEIEKNDIKNWGIINFTDKKHIYNKIRSLIESHKINIHQNQNTNKNNKNNNKKEEKIIEFKDGSYCNLIAVFYKSDKDKNNISEIVGLRLFTNNNNNNNDYFEIGICLDDNTNDNVDIVRKLIKPQSINHSLSQIAFYYEIIEDIIVGIQCHFISTEPRNKYNFCGYGNKNKKMQMSNQIANNSQND